MLCRVEMLTSAGGVGGSGSYVVLVPTSLLDRAAPVSGLTSGSSIGVPSVSGSCTSLPVTPSNVPTVDDAPGEVMPK